MLQIKEPHVAGLADLQQAFAKGGKTAYWSKMPEHLPIINQKIKKASCLSGGKVNISQTSDGFKIAVVGQPEKLIDTIIKLELQPTK